MIIEQTGQCTAHPNNKRLKLENAKNYARSATPGKAILNARRDGVPKAQLPSERQLKQYRPTNAKTKFYPAECIGSLHMFLDQRLQDALF
eukprot:811923-Karenia_brevis.AAC.1